MNEPCFIYVIGSQWSDTEWGPLKIGIATNVEKRLATMQTSQFNNLEVIFVEELSDKKQARLAERGCHTLLDRHRLKGEWFLISPVEAKETVGKVCRALRWKAKKERARRKALDNVPGLCLLRKSSDTLGGVP